MASQYIKDKLSLLPMKPGCYLMKDAKGKVIYVGKAKKLKNRVSSYFNGAHNYKTTKLVSNIADFEYIVTDSEKEALLLEINLIKDYSPEYNIMFMDSSYYPYIQLTNSRHPMLKIVREAKVKKHTYFGPFPDATAARDTFKLLNRLYPLRKCQRIPNKPCLYYHLGQCLAPCIKEVSEPEYKKITRQIKRFIKGDTKDIITELTEKMNASAELMNFEQAKEYRDLIKSINHVTSDQHVQLKDQVTRDILGYHVEKGYLSIQLFNMRNGKLLSRNINLVPVEDVNEQLTHFLVSYYQVNVVPKEVLLPGDFDPSLFQEIIDCKVIQPQKMHKADLVKMANENAREALIKKFMLMERVEANTIGAMKQLGELLNIPDFHRIELFDNSNIQGSYAVAGMVCFIDGLPSKKDYRKFKIKTVTGPDDYASMQEVVYRRYYRLLVNNLPMPDLVIVDGGKGQIKVAHEVIKQLNLPIRVCGLAKNDKHSTAMLLDEEGQEIKIDRKSKLFFFLTRMQDEVHRYAISFHKQVRGKAMTYSILDEVAGIGEKRRKLLLRKFGSLKKLKEADVKELAVYLPEKVAKDLYRVLRENN